MACLLFLRFLVQDRPPIIPIIVWLWLLMEKFGRGGHLVVLVKLEMVAHQEELFLSC